MMAMRKGWYAPWKSSSNHALNVDEKLNPTEKVVWHISNWINNRWFPQKKDEDIDEQTFRCQVFQEDWAKVNSQSSPSRKISDLFWMKLPWKKIRDELEGLRIIDVGCGKGRYGVKIMDFSDGILDEYLGIDAFPSDHWQELARQNSFIKFHKTSYDEIEEMIPLESRMIMTQSAVEHFRYDLVFFQQIAERAKKLRKPFLQIHLMPSAINHRLTGLHGVRHYTPRTLSRLAEPFFSFSKSKIYRLGGDVCNKVHWEYISQSIRRGGKGSSDLRSICKEEYKEDSQNAVLADMHSNCRNPSFYALIIHSYPQRDLF